MTDTPAPAPTVAELRATVAGLAAQYPLQTLVFYKARVLTLPDAQPIVFASLADVAAFVAGGTGDDVTVSELCGLVIAATADPTAPLPKRPDGKLIFDAPAWMSQSTAGTVARKARTPAEMTKLLADPNLPLDVRNEFEAALNLPITPPSAQNPGYKFPLPQLFDVNNELIPYTSFSTVAQRSDGSTVMIWGGTMPVQITKVVAGSGDELPAPPAMLAPNGGITIPLMRPLNLKVQATGLLMRNGKVVRDTPPSADVAASDAAHEFTIRGGSSLGSASSSWRRPRWRT